MFKKENFERFIKALLLVLLLVDLIYSFLQHYHTPFDGDIAGGVLPDKGVQQVLDSPLGLDVFTKGVTYPNPNRFFSHFFFYKYFNSVPFYLQSFTDPISSIYLSSAIIKTLIQLVCILFITIAIVGHSKLLNKNFLLAALVITPLFQTNGYRSFMGIIDAAITYNFFYSLPFLFLILFFLPLLMRYYYQRKKVNDWLLLFLLFLLSFIISLSSPINAGTVGVLALLFFIKKVFFSKHNVSLRNISTFDFLYFLPICALSIYSLYLGTFNAISITNHKPLFEMYSNIPIGLIKMLTLKLGIPLLILTIVLNHIFIKRLFQTNGKKYLSLSKWMLLFILTYIALLPLGGYRFYRPSIVRYDTLLPVLVVLFFMYGKSTLFLLNHLDGKRKFFYLGYVIMLMLVFTNADKPEFDKNACERASLEKISSSDAKIIELETACTVLSWGKMTKPTYSEANGQLLKRWNIIKEEKRYYSK